MKSAPLHIDYMQIDGRNVPVAIRHNPRARRIIVRVDLAAGSVQVTAPSKKSLAQALSFAREQRDWIAERLGQVPPPVPFVDGAVVPFKGEDHLIRHVSDPVMRRRYGPVWRVDTAATDGMPEIRATGAASFLQRRIGDWLKAQARAELNERALYHAERFDVRPSRITVRDTTTRWGSCAPSRALSFSWRLIMAPPHVLDYVAAHEVAHIRHMNHGARFWALVRQAIPNYETSKRWLETSGPGLHRYGAEPLGVFASEFGDGPQAKSGNGN